MKPLTRFFRRLVHGAPIIVVSGLPRSGTSMMMRMLAAGGLPLLTDDDRSADTDNPNGYYELSRIKNLARETDKRWLRGARGKGIKVVSTLLRDLPRSNDYKVILMRRDLDEVLASQAVMLARRGEEHSADDARIRQLFEDDLWRASYLLGHASHFDRLDIDYAHVICDPLGQARCVADFIGGNLDVDAMSAVVNPGLYRQRQSSSAPPR